MIKKGDKVINPYGEVCVVTDIINERLAEVKILKYNAFSAYLIENLEPTKCAQWQQ